MFSSNLELELIWFVLATGPIHSEDTHSVILVIVVLLEVVTQSGIYLLISLAEGRINTNYFWLHSNGIESGKLEQTDTVILLIIEQFLNVVTESNGLELMILFT